MKDKDYKDYNNEEYILDLISDLIKNGDRAPMELVKAIINKGEEAIERLSELITDRYLWQTEDEDEWWAPIHAVKILGAMRNEKAIPALLVCLKRVEEYPDNPAPEWIEQDLIEAFRQIGPASIKPLMEYIKNNPEEYWYSRAVASTALVYLASDYEEKRAEILEFLHSLLKEGNTQDIDFLSLLVCHLLDLCDPSSRPVIEEAFKKGLIDEVVVTFREVEEAYKKGPDIPNRLDFLEFYTPEAISARQKEWEIREREAEKIEEEERRLERLELLEEEQRQRLIKEGYEIDKHGTVRRKEPKIGPNDPCPCGSGKKYKKCCGRRK